MSYATLDLASMRAEAQYIRPAYQCGSALHLGRCVYPERLLPHRNGGDMGKIFSPETSEIAQYVVLPNG